MSSKEDEKEKDKRRVAPPKFASFRPKPAEEEPSSSTELVVGKAAGAGKPKEHRSPVEEGGEHARKHHRSHRHSKDEDDESSRHRHHHHRRHHRSRSRSRSPDARSPSRKKQKRDLAPSATDSSSKENHKAKEKNPPPPPPQKGEPGLFFFDRRGDPLIRQLGGNDRARVPRYRRLGGGRLLLGAPAGLRFETHFRGSREVFSLSERGARRADDATGARSVLSSARPGTGARSGSKKLRRIRAGGWSKEKKDEGEDGEEDPLRAITAAMAGSSNDADETEFIPLSQKRRRKRKRSVSSMDRDKIPDYRSLGGKGGSNNSDGSDSSSDDSVSSEDDSGVMTATKRKSLELSRHVRDRPGDIAVWLELIALQETLFRENRDDEEEDRARARARAGQQDWLGRKLEEARGIAELRVELYEEALPHASAPGDRERLLVGLMREGARVWSPKVLAARWDEVAGPSAWEEKEDRGCGFALWKERLGYELTNMATFTYERVRDFLVARLRRLRDDMWKIATATPTTITGDEDRAVSTLLDQTVYVFLRLSCFLRDCGYVELAVALWQAMLEISFARPTATSTSSGGGKEEEEEEDLASMQSLFTDFWESEVPRIGEPGAKGWTHFDPKTAAGEVPEAKRKEEETGPLFAGRSYTNHKDPYRAWAAAEQREAVRSRMPARTLDESSDVDPYRVVMASDLEDLLVWIPAVLLPRVRLRLVDAFLLFVGLPPALGVGAGTGRGGDNNMRSAMIEEALDDPFVMGRRSGAFGGRDRLSGTQQEEGSFYPPPGPQCPRVDVAFVQDTARIALSPEVLFAGPHWFQCLPAWTDMFGPEDEQVDCAWVLGTLRHLVLAEGVEALADYYLAMEWRNGAGARKAAKALLRQYSGNIRLYNGYALVERENGHLDIAQKVLAMATARDLSSESDSSQLLWNTRAWIELETGEKQAALISLCSSVPGAKSALSGSKSDRSSNSSSPNQTSPALLLRTRSHFASTRDYALSAGKLEHALQHAQSLALFEYLAAMPREKKTQTQTQNSSLEEEPAAAPPGPLQGDIAAAMLSVRTFSDELELRARGLGTTTHHHHERLAQFAARLLHWHANHGPFRPAYLRAQLTHLASLFPRNTLLLSLFEWAHHDRDRGLFVLRADDPVRTLLREGGSNGKESSNTTTAFAIRHEIRHGTAHSARRAFEDALLVRDGNSTISTSTSTSTSTQGCAVLWTDYVRFCRNRRRELWGTGSSRGSSSRRSKKKKGVAADSETEKRKEKEKEKAVLYRAVAACPWLRTAYMEAFRGRDGDEFRDEELDLDEPEDDEERGAMTSAELEALADTMVVKGLRVRVAVDEFVDEFAKDG